MSEANSNERPLSTGEWFLTMLVLAIPIVGLVIHFVWAFSDGNIGRRNFCRAALLWLLVAAMLGLITMIVIIVFFGGLAAHGLLTVANPPTLRSRRARLPVSSEEF